MRIPRINTLTQVFPPCPLCPSRSRGIKHVLLGSQLHTTIRHLVVVLERFSCGHFHKSLIINTKNTQNYRREYPSFYPSKKFRRRVARGNQELYWFPLQTKHCLSQFATGGSPGVIQRRGVGRRNGEIKNAATESGVPRFSLHSLHVLHGEVYLSFLGVLCVLCGKSAFVFFRVFSCLSWLTCIT